MIHLFVITETLVEVPFCPKCGSEMVLEVPSEPAGRTQELSGLGGPPRVDSSTVNQSLVTSIAGWANKNLTVSLHSLHFTILLPFKLLKMSM